jgi:hypothetical protein
LEKLRQNRKREAERKIAEEKLKAQEAKLKFEEQQLQQKVRKNVLRPLDVCSNHKFYFLSRERAGLVKGWESS